MTPRIVRIDGVKTPPNVLNPAQVGVVAAAVLTPTSGIHG